jgi:hypothetical protein
MIGYLVCAQVQRNYKKCSGITLREMCDEKTLGCPLNFKKCKYEANSELLS